MGKKRIIKKSGGSDVSGSRSLARAPKKKLDSGVLYIKATFNNTLLTFADQKGNSVLAASSGSIGFAGSRKSTPFAAAKVGEMIGEKAQAMGVKDAQVVISGIGAGRESALRAFSGKGINISRIIDATPVPHNGPRAPRPRRV